MFIKKSVLPLSLALFIGVAAAQAPSWAIVKGLHLQPTQQQVDSKGDKRARQWGRGVQSEPDRLYERPIDDADDAWRNPGVGGPPRAGTHLFRLG